MPSPAAAHLPADLALRLDAALAAVDARIAAWSAAGEPKPGAAPCDTTGFVERIRKARDLALGPLGHAKPGNREAAAAAAITTLERILDQWPMS